VKRYQNPTAMAETNSAEFEDEFEEVVRPVFWFARPGRLLLQALQLVENVVVHYIETNA
jgi:hypothetical protein